MTPKAKSKKKPNSSLSVGSTMRKKEKVTKVGYEIYDTISSSTAFLVRARVADKCDEKETIASGADLKGEREGKVNEKSDKVV